VAGSDPLVEILTEARALGYLGPGPIEPQLEHARGFAVVVAVVRTQPPERFADLGTGGGLPGLVLALEWPAARGVLVDASARRCSSLRGWATRLGLDGRIIVLEGRAEAFAREAEYREQFDVVTARGLARPAVTAEVAAGFVVPGGALVVSEPPSGKPERWPPAALAELGFGPPVWHEAESGTYVCVPKSGSTPIDVPRAAPGLVKRPRW
jgi:16S rRNA (guanine527-N7)-methyltransferase